MGIARSCLIVTVLGLTAAACGSEDSEDSPPPAAESTPAPFDPQKPYAPEVAPSDLSPEITNPFLPMPVGAKWVSELLTDDGTEHIEVTVQAETRMVWGAEVRVVRDTATFIPPGESVGELIEDTEDWFAQDSAGNVWYMGEQTTAFDPGMEPSTAGSWEAGVDDALPGVLMLASPKVGQTYRQEYYAGEAEDYAIVSSLDASASVPAGDYSGCIKTEERSVLEPDVLEYKYYCEGVGNVLVDEDGEREELLDVSGL